jgi:hypothetical protein
MDFHINDIDQQTWDKRSREECDKIKTNKSFILSGRSEEDLLFRSRQGQAAEVFLMEHCGYDDDIRDYHDVRDPEGNYVEVKVVGSEKYLVDNLEKWAYDKSSNWWKNWPNILMVWENNGYDPDYKYLGKYYWNDNNKSWRKDV